MLNNYAIFDVRHHLVWGPQDYVYYLDQFVPWDSIAKTIAVVWDPEETVKCVLEDRPHRLYWIDLAKPIQWSNNKLTCIRESEAWYLVDAGLWARVGTLQGLARTRLWAKLVWETRPRPDPTFERSVD